MNMFKVLLEVITPGKAEFKAHLTRYSDEERKLLKYLHILEQPATLELSKATEEAAEF